MKKILILLVLTTISFGQNTKRNFLYSKGLHVNVSDGAYHFKFINSNIVETTFIPNNEKHAPESVATIPVNSDNYDITSIENDNEISISYQNLTIKITKQPFQISYSYKNKEILAEKLGYFKRKHIPLDIVKDNIKADSTEVLQFSITPNEILYGGGARALGMNRRGNKLALYNRAHYGYEDQAALMNFTLPIVISSNKYMVHFDNAPVGYLDL
nr:alpha-glucosidase domain-containing protein [uncultured Flavobacterium sp.]